MAIQPSQIQPSRMAADALRRRREAVERMDIVRARGFSAIAQDYERLIARWDELLDRYGAKHD